MTVSLGPSAISTFTTMQQVFKTTRKDIALGGFSAQSVGFGEDLSEKDGKEILVVSCRLLKGSGK